MGAEYVFPKKYEGQNFEDANGYAAALPADFN